MPACPSQSKSELKKPNMAAAPFAMPWTVSLIIRHGLRRGGVGRVAWSFGTVTLACCKCELFSTGQLPICLLALLLLSQTDLGAGGVGYLAPMGRVERWGGYLVGRYMLGLVSRVLSTACLPDI